MTRCLRFAFANRLQVTRRIVCDKSSLSLTTRLAGFVTLLLAAAYLGLSTQKIPQYGQSDKGLHLLTFFLLTVRPPPSGVMRRGTHPFSTNTYTHSSPSTGSSRRPAAESST